MTILFLLIVSFTSNVLPVYASSIFLFTHLLTRVSLSFDRSTLNIINLRLNECGKWSFIPFYLRKYSTSVNECCPVLNEERTLANQSKIPNRFIKSYLLLLNVLKSFKMDIWNSNCEWFEQQWHRINKKIREAKQADSKKPMNRKSFIICALLNQCELDGPKFKWDASDSIVTFIILAIHRR